MSTSVLTKTQHRTLLLALDLLEQAKTHITDIRSQLNDDFDELSDEAQSAPTGDALSETISQLDDALDSLENTISNIPTEEPT